MSEPGDSRRGPGPADPPGEAKLPGGLTLRALIPNAITSAALCCGLTGIRFAIHGDWEKSVQVVILAGMLDGIDGRIARLLKAQSRFGAELDSLADAISFGVAPALIVFLWSLKDAARLGWFAALAFAICCVLRLARFNARIDMPDQPHKQAGFLTGVPAPVGAGLAFLPMFLWFAIRDLIATERLAGEQLDIAQALLSWTQDPRVVGVWLVLIAFLLISSVATMSWQLLRPRKTVRLEIIAAVGLTFAALLTEPWWTLTGICLAYLLMVPFGIVGYARFKRQRATRQGAGPNPPAA